MGTDRTSRSRHEPDTGCGARMDTVYLLRYANPRDGRVITKDRFAEAEARRIFPDAERVEASQVEAEHCGHIGWCFPSGLVRRSDGVMTQPTE